MRNLLFSIPILALWFVACGPTTGASSDTPADAASDSATCTGTPPTTCDGCCGSKYTADVCSSGAWTCRPLGAACAVCDAGTDSAVSDAPNDSETCTGTPPATCDGCCGSKYAADQCLGGVWTCRPLGGACSVCDSGTDSSASDAPNDSATCTGTPPAICNGCCGIKYAADQCLSGVWTCRPLGIACVVCDAGTDSAANDASSDSATCRGTAPNCFGSNSTQCCGSDPIGPSVCSGGVWMCGSATAPGCNGKSAVGCLQEAGPG